MTINNVGNINMTPQKREELVPVASVSVLAQNAKSTNVRTDEIKPATESKLKKAADFTQSSLNDDELKRISEKLQSMFDADLIFTVDQRSGEHVIQVIDKSTKEVIRQIPSDEAIRIKESIDRFQKGLLVNIKT